jgi:hypothetical protein
MKPGPASAKSVLTSTILVDATPKPAVECLASICLSQGWCSDECDAGELAEKWEARFIELLQYELSELHRIGRFSAFTFNSSSSYLIQGSAFIEPIDTEEVKEAKRRRSRCSEYTAAFAHCSPRDFEALCVGILDLIGVEEPRITPYSADEGIDFYGRLKLDRFIFAHDFYPGIQNQLTVWMLGQAKHYSGGTVSTFEIRDLVGAVELAKGGAFGASPEKYADLRIRVCDPIFYLFFTTGRISLNSWRLIERSGVAAMDGDMIAALLADRAIGVDADHTFQADLLKQWILKYHL